MQKIIDRKVKQYFDSSGVSLLESRILIVDDSEFSRSILIEIFKKNGFRNIEYAEDGEIGLEKLESFEPDIIILDIVMPKVDGFEFCERVRGCEKFSGLPILVQSGTSDPYNITKIFSVGATDFVSKPVNAEEVIVRSIVHLENKILINDLMKYRKKAEEELRNAREMQNNIVPSDDCIYKSERMYGLSIAAYFEPSFEVGGDLWGMKNISDNEVAIYSVDFSGHGVTSALNTFRLHTILQSEDSFSDDPSLFLYNVNNRLKKLLNVGQFATMIYAVINIKKNVMTYASAGHTSPIVFRENGEGEMLDSAGVPLGVARNTTYDLKETEFSKGDLVLMYSDALIETGNEQGDFLSEKDIFNLVKYSKGLDSKVIMEALLEKYHKHCGAVEQSDDLTINIYKRK